METQALYLDVDAGGTSCRVKIISADGAELAESASGGANARIGIEKLHRRLMATCEEAAYKAGLSDDQLGRVSAAMGIAGIAREGAKDALC